MKAYTTAEGFGKSTLPTNKQTFKENKTLKTEKENE